PLELGPSEPLPSSAIERVGSRLSGSLLPDPPSSERATGGAENTSPPVVHATCPAVSANTRPYHGLNTATPLPVARRALRPSARLLPARRHAPSPSPGAHPPLRRGRAGSGR